MGPQDARRMSGDNFRDSGSNFNDRGPQGGFQQMQDRLPPMRPWGQGQGGSFGQGGPNVQDNFGGDMRGGEGQRAQGGDMRGGEGGQPFADDGRQLKQMQQQMRGMERGLANMAKSIARIKKAGGSVPAEYETTITNLTSAIATVKGATEMTDEVQAAVETIQDSGSDMAELGPKLGMLEQFPRILKEASKQVAQARKQLTKSVAKAQKSGVDVTGIKASIEAKLAEYDTAIAAAKGPSDPEEAMNTLREDVFGGMEDLRDEMMVLENISNSSQMLKSAEKEIARIEKASVQLQKRKKDTAELDSIIVEMKTKLAETKVLMRGTNVDRDSLVQAFTEGEQLHNDALDALAKLRGEKTDVEKQFEAPDAAKTNAMGAAVYEVYRTVQDWFGF